MTAEESEIKQTPAIKTEYPEDVLERFRSIYSGLRDNRQVLLDLFREGKQDELDEGIDNLSDDLLVEDVTYQDLRQQLADNRKNAGPTKEKREQEIVAHIRELQENYRQVVVLDLNLPDKARLNSLDRAASNVQDFLHDHDFDGQSPHEALRILGIEIPLEDGKITYQFPTEFMPKEVNTKWSTYLSTVIAHYKAMQKLDNGTGSQAEVSNADLTRKYAHDSVTADVHRILGFDGLEKWNLLSTRNTLAAIRDSVLPNEAAITSDASKKLFEEHHSYVAASHLLASRHHN